MYLKLINLLTNIPISCSVANLDDAAFGKEKKKSSIFQFLECSVLMNTMSFYLLIVLIVTLRAGYSTYVFVVSLVTESPDFPGPCIDSMAVE